MNKLKKSTGSLLVYLLLEYFSEIWLKFWLRGIDLLLTRRAPSLWKITVAFQCVNLQSFSSSQAFRILERCSGSVMFSSLRWDSCSPAKSSRVWKPCMDSKELSSWNREQHTHGHSGGYPQCKQMTTSPASVWQTSYIKADAVQHLFQGFGFGFGSTALVSVLFPPGWRAVFRQQVDVDELKGAHFVVELPCPDSNRRLLNDVDGVSFL